jgi:hypothetical protein
MEQRPAAPRWLLEVVPSRRQLEVAGDFGFKPPRRWLHARSSLPGKLASALIVTAASLGEAAFSTPPSPAGIQRQHGAYCRFQSIKQDPRECVARVLRAFHRGGVIEVHGHGRVSRSAAAPG